MAKLLTAIKRFIGESSDRKATDVPDGSTFLEKDTGNLFIFSTTDGGWHLKDETTAALRLETIKRDDDILAELKKVNENLLLVVEALDG